MGLFTPKYPKPDTPGAGVPQTRRERREANRQPSDNGATEDEMRARAMRRGATVTKRGKYMVVVTDNLYGGNGFSSERYIQRPDGKWIAG